MKSNVVYQSIILITLGLVISNVNEVCAEKSLEGTYCSVNGDVYQVNSIVKRDVGIMHQNMLSTSVDEDTEEHIYKFTRSIDTFYIKQEEEVKKAVIYNGQYYCLFEAQSQEAGTLKKMIVINERGQLIEELYLPELVQYMNFFDLEVSGDVLYLKHTQQGREVFEYNKHAKSFLRVKTRVFSIYEDSLYTLYPLCFGEWGGAVVFNDKETGGSYCLPTGPCPLIVNKQNGVYYIAKFSEYGFSSIDKIVDPKMLQRIENVDSINYSNLDEHYQYMKNRRTEEQTLNMPNSTLYTTYRNDGAIFCLFSDSTGTHVGRVEKDNLKKMYSFERKFRARLSQVVKEDHQLLIFTEDDGNDGGLLEIEDGEFRFTYLKLISER